ncbi:MAG: tRNA guanosine(34) transglycosylase Tgt [Gammaproteobacteria bacterium]|nr:tRNA guanosine(34) transglycosylase Tgt [Gammaproteobacteria bacterium]
MGALKFELEHQDKTSGARTGKITLTHGTYETPIFMPVGTKGDVKCLTNEEVKEVSEGLILANTYHLWLSPGEGLFRKINGLRNYSKWDGSYLTDSGGFQVFSLSKMRDITEDGVYFRHYKNGSKLFMSPEISIHMQNAIGSDIMMSFDECPPFDSSYEYMRDSVLRTIRWAKRGKEANMCEDTQALFGIVQGGPFNDLRQLCIDELSKIGFDGFSIGGLAVGETRDERNKSLNYLRDHMPKDKPRYLMGVGTPEDILLGIENGVDMFDCVEPTRIARHGVAMTSSGRVLIKNKCFEEDFSPLDNECDCEVCKKYSKSYIRHLFREDEMLSYRFLSYHNLYFLRNLVRGAKKAIREDRFTEFKNEFLNKYNKNNGEE